MHKLQAEAHTHTVALWLHALKVIHCVAEQRPLPLAHNISEEISNQVIGQTTIKTVDA